MDDMAVLHETETGSERSEQRFDGPEFVAGRDAGRLGGQIQRIWDVMSDRQWRSLAEINAATGDPVSSISAQLRHMRKPRFGMHAVDRRNRGGGLFEYQVIPNADCPRLEKVDTPAEWGKAPELRAAQEDLLAGFSRWLGRQQPVRRNEPTSEDHAAAAAHYLSFMETGVDPVVIEPESDSMSDPDSLRLF